MSDANAFRSRLQTLAYRAIALQGCLLTTNNWNSKEDQPFHLVYSRKAINRLQFGLHPGKTITSQLLTSTELSSKVLIATNAIVELKLMQPDQFYVISSDVRELNQVLSSILTNSFRQTRNTQS